MKKGFECGSFVCKSLIEIISVVQEAMVTPSMVKLQL